MEKIAITPKIDLRTNRIFDRGKWRDLTTEEYVKYQVMGSKPIKENPVRESLANFEAVIEATTDSYVNKPSIPDTTSYGLSLAEGESQND